MANNKSKTNRSKLESVILMTKFEDGKIKSIDKAMFYDNPPVEFGPKATVKTLDVVISSTDNEDKELLQHLLQKTRRSGN